MNYIKYFNTFRKVNENTHTKLYDLIRCFEMTHEEKIQLLPEFFYRNYPDILYDWCTDNVHLFVDEEHDEESYIIPDSINTLLQYPDAYDKYCNYLYDISKSAIYNNDNQHDLNIAILPPFLTFTYEGLIDNEWMCHFCGVFESVENIIKSKYFLGVDDIDTITITTVNENEKIPNGYCFAYSINDTYYNFDAMNNGSVKYGNDGVIFKSSGVKLFHSGDNELQVIFIGNTATNMVGFHRDEKTKLFYTLDKTISDIDFDSFKEKVINSVNINESVKAYHGSIHKFDKFTTDKMGTGEGNQSFGWGLYFTDIKDIADGYATTATDVVKKYNLLSNNDKQLFIKELIVKVKSLEKNGDISKDKMTYVINELNRKDIDISRIVSIASSLPDDFMYLIRTKFSGVANVYDVTLHKGKTPNQYVWLEWDKKPSIKIISKVLKGLRNIGIDFAIQNNTIYYKRNNATYSIVLYNGMSLYTGISGIFASEDGDEKASLFLLKNGIDGVKYETDSRSQGNKKYKTSGFNYVVFDANAVTIDSVKNINESLENIDLGGGIKNNTTSSGTYILPIDEIDNLRNQKESDLATGNAIDLERDLLKNGIKEPLVIMYYPNDGKAFLSDGHHRLDTLKDIGVEKLPIRIVNKYTDAPRNAKEWTPPREYFTNNLNESKLNIDMLIEEIKKTLIMETLVDEDEFNELYNGDWNLAWRKFVDDQENGDCQGIVSSIIMDFPQVKKVFGEIEVDNSYIDEDGEEQTLMTHHWVKIMGKFYDFSKGTLKNYIDFDDIYNVNIDGDEWRYN